VTCTKGEAGFAKYCSRSSRRVIRDDFMRPSDKRGPAIAPQHTVLSEIGFPSRAVATKFAPHRRQELLSQLGASGIAFRCKAVSTLALSRND
jgi:hypothetical protein